MPDVTVADDVVVTGVDVEVGIAVGVDVDVGVAVGAKAGVGVEVVTGAGLVPVGAVTAFASRVTAVCASARPFNIAPVLRTTAVCESMIPLTFEVVPSVAWPATCQNTFWDCAPPLRTTLAPLPTLSV